MTDGPQLGSEIAEACERARFTAPRFASLRNRLPSSALELGREALPGDLHQPVTSAKPPEASRPSPPQPPAPADGLAARLAAGPISIYQLFLDGVYDGEVSPWHLYYGSITYRGVVVIHQIQFIGCIAVLCGEGRRRARRSGVGVEERMISRAKVSVESVSQ